MKGISYRTLFGLFLVGSLGSGCIEKTEPRFKPSDDPLVRRIFEKELSDAGIAYRADDDGFYVAPNEVIDRMLPLSRKALAAASATSTVPVTPGCPFEKLKGSLDKQGAIYVADRAQSPHTIRMTTADANRLHLLESSVMANSACARGE